MIQLRFFGSDGLAARAIEWFSAGYFSHVAAVWTPAELLDSRSDELGGIPAGVQIRPQIVELAEIMVTMQLRATSDQEYAWRKFLIAQIGKPYDKPGIWGFALGRSWREPDSWFCSELQAAALEEAGVCPRLYTPANKITPVALATIVSALGGEVT